MCSTVYLSYTQKAETFTLPDLRLAQLEVPYTYQIPCARLVANVLAALPELTRLTINAWQRTEVHMLMH